MYTIRLRSLSNKLYYHHIFNTSPTQSNIQRIFEFKKIVLKEITMDESLFIHHKQPTTSHSICQSNFCIIYNVEDRTDQEGKVVQDVFERIHDDCTFGNKYFLSIFPCA